MLYYKFTERNSWKGESWNFYLKLSKEQHKKLKELIDNDYAHHYSLSELPISEKEVDELVKYSKVGYIPFHNKVEIPTFPNEVEWGEDDPFYEGWQWDFYREPKLENIPKGFTKKGYEIKLRREGLVILEKIVKLAEEQNTTKSKKFSKLLWDRSDWQIKLYTDWDKFWGFGIDFEEGWLELKDNDNATLEQILKEVKEYIEKEKEFEKEVVDGTYEYGKKRIQMAKDEEKIKDEIL